MTTTSRSPARLQRRRDVGERVRIANRHQHVAGTRLDLVERELGGEQQVERALVGAERRPAPRAARPAVNQQRRAPR